MATGQQTGAPGAAFAVRVLVAGSCVAAGIGWAAPPAHACLRAFGPQLVSVEVPADGAIVAVVRCPLDVDMDCPELADVELEVTGPDASALAGTADAMPVGGGDDWVLFWVSEDALPEGERLTVAVRWQGGLDERTVRVVEPLGEPRFVGVPDPRATSLLVEHGDRRLCCSRSCAEPCITAERRVLVALSVDAWLSERHPRHREQFVYRMVDPERAPSSSPWQDSVDGSFLTVDQQQERYCIVLERMLLTTGQVERSEPSCVAHGELPDVGVRATTESEAEAWMQQLGCDRYADGAEVLRVLEHGPAEDGGCAVAGPPARTTGAPSPALLALAGLALWLRRRRPPRG